MLEFGLPRGILAAGRGTSGSAVGLPLAGRLSSRRAGTRWAASSGRRSGRSTRRSRERDLLALWRAAGIDDVRARRLSLGGGLVVWGRRGDGPEPAPVRAPPSTPCAPAAGATASRCSTSPTPRGTCRTPSSAAASPRASTGPSSRSRCSPSRSRWGSAHTRSTSSTAGRSARRSPPDLVGLAALASVAAAAAIGIVVALDRTLWILPLVALGAALVPVYNLELLGGRAHTDLGFALAWGAFPVVTAFVAQTGTLRAEALLAALWATLLSLAQRRLSTPARRLRRREGPSVGDLAPLESALRLLTGATVVLAAALVVLRA